MPVLKLVGLASILEQTKKGLSKALGGQKAVGGVWRICTPLPDGQGAVQKSRFFKSITEDIDDATKIGTFVQLVSAIGSASNLENYHDFFRNGGVECKEAHSFNHKGQRVKIYELKKHRKKERLYFATFSAKGMRFFVLLLAHHKKDETTPKHISTHCETQISQLLNAGDQTYILE
jgi:hypothetical protein